MNKICLGHIMSIIEI